MKKFIIVSMAFLLLVICAGCAPEYATSSELDLLAQRYDELAEKSVAVSKNLTENSKGDESLYNKFNEITVEANAFSTEISSFNEKKINREDYTRLLNECDRLLKLYGELDKEISKKK